MICLTAFNPGVVLYVYDKPTVVLTGGMTWNKDHFIAIFNLFGFCGGLAGRWLSYNLQPQHPLLYFFVSMIGIGVITQWIPLLAPIGALFMMLGDGLIYGSISRHVDECISKEFNMIAITSWLLFGDLGSIA